MNPYEVLGVGSSASMVEIEARYRLLLREYHPDLHHHEGAEAVQAAEEATRMLNSAMDAIRRGAGPIPPRGPSQQPPPWAGTSTHWGTSTRTDERDQWPGSNPFWRSPEDRDHADHAGGDSNGSAGADDEGAWRGHRAQPPYDWFGNPTEHRPDEPVPCPYCGRPYERLDDYEYHLESVHRFRKAVKTAPKHPGWFTTAFGKLRFIPLWFLVPLAFGNWRVFGFPYFTATLALVLLVLYTQTNPRFRGR